MALSTVTLKWNLTDLVQGGQTATLIITPSAQMADSTDHVLVAQPVPRRVVFSGGQGQLAGIVANDNSSILPAGTGYTIEVVTSAGAVVVPAFTTQLLTANGATQWLDQLAPVSAVTTGYLFLPLPSGTPQAGQVPGVIANGSPATAWTTGGGVGTSPTFTGTVTVAGQMIKVGPTTYSFTPVGSNSSYLLIDKAATAGDASLVLRDQGAIRGEVGLAADDNLHVKAATGAAGSETFTDAILVLNSSANVEIVNQLGIGTAPSAQLHVAGAAGTGGRTLAKLENTTGAGAGFDFVGDSPNVQWGLLTDIALNGGNNFGIFDLVAGYPPQVTVAGAGGGVSVGSDTVQPSAAHSLDVVGSVQTRGVHGLSPANFVGRGTVTGPPASGTFQTGDAMLDSAGTWFICTAGGTPGTWSSGATPWFTKKSGAYIQGQTSVSTSTSLGNQLLRLTPVIVTSPLTITQLGTELITAGDANSLIRLAMYADDGTGYPGSLLVDAGSISTGTGNAGGVATGGVAGVYMITLGTPQALTPGLYWLGGAVQGVTVTQPTMRTGSFGNQFAGGPNAVPGVSAAQLGYTQSSVSGAMPGTFNAFSSAGAAGTVPRIIFKIQ